METADALIKQLPNKTHPLSRYIHFDERSLAAVVDALAYWAKPLQKSTKKLLTIMHGLRPTIADHMDDTTTSNWLKGLADAGKRPPSAFDDINAERLIFKRTKVLLPPRNHIWRYPALKELTDTYDTAPHSLYARVREELERTWKPNPTLFVRGFIIAESLH